VEYAASGKTKDNAIFRFLIVLNIVCLASRREKPENRDSAIPSRSALLWKPTMLHMYGSTRLEGAILLLLLSSFRIWFEPMLFVGAFQPPFFSYCCSAETGAAE
jgi:hypothetical protein